MSEIDSLSHAEVLAVGLAHEVGIPDLVGVRHRAVNKLTDGPDGPCIRVAWAIAERQPPSPKDVLAVGQDRIDRVTRLVQPIGEP